MHYKMLEPPSSLLHHFYTTRRIPEIPGSGICMFDEGGPFGFDVHFALEVDYLVRAYGCRHVVETGTHAGDTAEYLAKQYPDVRITTIEVDPVAHVFARSRLRCYPNVRVVRGSSDAVLASLELSENTLFYLDAHGREGAAWPLVGELVAIREGCAARGVVCVGDCDIGHEEYSYDHYDGVKCDASLLAGALGSRNPESGMIGAIYSNDPECRAYPYPCLQMRRLSGRMYARLPREDRDLFADCPFFKLLR